MIAGSPSSSRTLTIRLVAVSATSSGEETFHSGGKVSAIASSISEHQVHVLDRCPRSTLAEIVEQGDEIDLFAALGPNT